MAKMIKISIISMSLVISLSMTLSCAPTTSQQGQDILKSELSTIQSELSATRSELSATRSELSATENELSATQSELSTTESELSATRSELIAAKKELASLQSQLAEADIKQAQYEELLTQCEESKEQYEAITEGTVEITEEDVEQSIFKLINQERKDNGLNELIWQDGLYSCARSNNLKMAETKDLQNPECPSFNQVFWFLGYGTAEQIANTALTTWKNNLYSYTQNILSKSAYGAVAVYRSEDILYITYVAYTDIY
jgi:uncharacterized protein YkwD